MILTTIIGNLALASLGLTLWQWLAGRRFPLHQRQPPPPTATPVTVLKPLKGADECTEACLRSWFAQDYPGDFQLLFAVESADDPAAAVVRKLLKEFPGKDAQLVICAPLLGTNPKVAKLMRLESVMKHEVLALSDADVFAPSDCLRHVVAPLQDRGVGIVNCFYQLARPATLAMCWEAIAVNADFWSQVLQARSLGPQRFALGATLALRREALQRIGGFAALADCLADDYQLGRRVAAAGYCIELCPVVTECREAARGWAATWRHQLRWARTIRVCQPAAYFASILGNPTLWCALWLATVPGIWPTAIALGGVLARIAVAVDLSRRLTGASDVVKWAWLVPVKDLLQAALWVAAFTGDRVEWRGESYRVRSDGSLGVLLKGSPRNAGFSRQRR